MKNKFILIGLSSVFILCGCSGENSTAQNSLILNDEYYLFKENYSMRIPEKGKSSFYYFNDLLMFDFGYVKGGQYNPLTDTYTLEHYQVQMYAYKHYNDKVFTGSLYSLTDFTYALQTSGLNLNDVQYEDLNKITNSVTNIFIQFKNQVSYYQLDWYTPTRGILRQSESGYEEYLAYSYAISQGIVE